MMRLNSLPKAGPSTKAATIAPTMTGTTIRTIIRNVRRSTLLGLFCCFDLILHFLALMLQGGSKEMDHRTSRTCSPGSMMIHLQACMSQGHGLILSSSTASSRWLLAVHLERYEAAGQHVMTGEAAPRSGLASYHILMGELTSSHKVAASTNSRRAYTGRAKALSTRWSSSKDPFRPRARLTAVPTLSIRTLVR